MPPATPTSILRRLHRRAPAILLVVVALASALMPATAGADAKSDRAEVKRQRAALAAELDTLRATDAEVEAALAALNDNVISQSAALRDAERLAAEADAARVEATLLVEAKEAEIARLEEAVRAMAIEAYVSGPSSGGIADQLDSESIGEAELKQSLLEARTSAQLDSLDQLERAREDLAIAQAAAASAAVAAEQNRAAVDQRLASVSAARDQQATVAVNVQLRLDHKLGEAANLATLDKQLSDQIAAEEARLAAAAREAAARRPAVSGGPISITGSGNIVSVRGIRVHRSIAENLRGLLAAAEGDGIVLSGGGYRDPNQQIALRRRHCGTSNYAVYHMSPSQCRPPTARPGQSNHERGLAVDFTYQGRAIRSRSSAAFQWMRANASRFGFYNLPSEPWHWSVNGN